MRPQLRDLVLLLLGVVVFVCVAGSHGYDIRKNLATKTPYWDQSTGVTPPPDGCYPIHLNLLARHGSREPTEGDIATLSQLEKKIASIKQGINNQDYNWMKSWVNPFATQAAGWLTFQGEEEHYDLAQRFIQYMPDVLNSKYTPARFSLRSTQISRTGRSGNAFSYALFEGKGNIGKGKYDPFFITAANLTLDYELRFFSTCPTYINKVAENASAIVEGALWANRMFPLIAQNISDTLNLSDGYSLSVKDVKALWTACTLQISVEEIDNQFCSLFPEPAARIMNYYADLQSWWQKGYGYAIDYTIACPLMQDMVGAMIDVVSNPPNGYTQRANLRFAHAETVMPFLALLGMFKDNQPLLHDSPQSFIDNHKWNTSVISTYAANVALILYNCTSSSSDYRLKLLVNEKESLIPSCGGLYCPLKDFIGLYKSPLQNCDFEKMCGITPCGKKKTTFKW